MNINYISQMSITLCKILNDENMKLSVIIMIA